MRKALGRGLDALLPGAPARQVPTRPAAPHATPAAQAGPAGSGPDDPAVRAHPVRVPVTSITPNPEQPRRHFDAAALATLAESIRRHGLLQPLVVRSVSGGYELIAGERRWRAAQRAGLTEVPVVVREADVPDARLELALIENLQREDLSALDEAEAYRQLADVYGLTQEEIARRVGKSRPAIANALRLLALPDAVKAQLESGALTAGHARAVLQLDDAAAQIAFAREIVTAKMPKSAAERAAAARRRPESRPRELGTAPGNADVHARALAEELTRELGTKVRLLAKGSRGRLEIEFYSFEQLDGLVARLRAGEGAMRSNAF